MLNFNQMPLGTKKKIVGGDNFSSNIAQWCTKNVFNAEINNNMLKK